MTIKQRQYLHNVSQQNKTTWVLECQKEKPFEAAREELLVNGGQAAELSPQCCEVRRQIDGVEGNLTEGKNSDGGGNNLLMILANSAELMSESQHSLHTTVDVNHQEHEELDSTMVAQHWDVNVKDEMATDNGKKLDEVDEIPLIAHERNDKDGSNCEGKLPRLSQIRRQARLKSQSCMQQSIQEDGGRSLQGSKQRLTQIRRQARLGNHVPVQEDIAGCSHGKLMSGITRLSQIRRQARSRSNCSQQEGTGEHTHRHLDCQFHEDHQKEDKAAEQCPKLDSYQAIGASSSCSDADHADKLMCGKGRLRLSQLRRKARLANSDSAAQKNACNSG